MPTRLEALIDFLRNTIARPAVRLGQLTAEGIVLRTVQMGKVR